MSAWAINGRFMMQPTTGVQRVARELLAALDRRLQGADVVPSFALLLPPGAPQPALGAMPSRRVPGPRHPHLWEQWALPRAVGEGRLLNLCGAAPAFGAVDQACLLHDAAVFDHPEAYTGTFVRWYRWMFRRLARSPARLITVSNFSRSRLALALGVPASRIAVVPLAADHMHRADTNPQALHRHGLTNGPFLLAVGSANPTKRQDLIVRAWRRLGRSDARLVIAGGTNPAIFEASAHHVAEGVLRTGQVDDATLKALYGAAAGLVFPSSYEGFGLPPLEAMACGCPVVVSRAEALQEVCGDAALSVPVDDERALAEAMHALLDDQTLRASLRDRGRDRAATFTWDASAQALLDALASEPGR